MAVTITAQARNNRGAALLTLAVTQGTGTGVVTRRFGNTTELIRENPVPLSTTPIDVLDYEVPLETEVTYNVVVDGTGEEATSNPVTVTGNGQDFIVSLSDPSRSQHVNVVAQPDLSYQTRVSVLPIIARGNPVSQSDKIIYGSGTLVILSESASERDSLEALLADGWPFLFKTPPSRAGRRYMVATAVKTSRVSPLATESVRYHTIDFQTVDAAASIYTPVAGQYTWDDLVLEAAIWDDVKGLYPRWSDVVTGPSSSGKLGGF